jgi:hypothetical protein
MKLLSTLIVTLLHLKMLAQIDYKAEVMGTTNNLKINTPYYTDLSDQLLIKLTTNFKYTTFEIINKNTNKMAQFYPNGNFDLGIDVSYKWAGLGIAYGLPNSDTSTYQRGTTKRFDLQLNLYPKTFAIDALLQRYKGFYLYNPQNFTEWDSEVSPQSPDMKNYYFGVSAYYIFNHKKFSYRAAYVRSEIQNKSAGSLFAGPFLNIDKAQSSDQFIPEDLPQAVQDTFDINLFSSIAYGIAVGYTYTLVIIKNGFINMSLAPGIGVKNLKTSNGDVIKTTKSGISTRVALKLALGYEYRSYLFGLNYFGTEGSIASDNLEFRPGTGNLMFFLAKRFNVKKKNTNKTIR